MINTIQNTSLELENCIAALQYNTKHYNKIMYFNKKSRAKSYIKEITLKMHEYITRANDRSKALQDKAVKLLANLERLLKKNDNKEIFITHSFISRFTKATTTTHNKRILDQLADIFNFEYKRWYKKTNKSGYIVTYTSSGLDRLKNTHKYYYITEYTAIKNRKRAKSKKLSDNVSTNVTDDKVLNKNVEDYKYNKELLQNSFVFCSSSSLLNNTIQAQKNTNSEEEDKISVFALDEANTDLSLYTSSRIYKEYESSKNHDNIENMLKTAEFMRNVVKNLLNSS